MNLALLGPTWQTVVGLALLANLGPGYLYPGPKLASAVELDILKDVGPAAELVPVAAIIVTGVLLLGKFIVIPLANIVFGHQRQLAGVETPAAETDRRKIERLESELQELKDRMNEQAILLDDRRTAMGKSEEIESRLKN